MTDHETDQDRARRVFASLVRSALCDAGRPLAADQLLDARVSLRDVGLEFVWFPEDVERLLAEVLPEVADHDRVFRLADGRLVHEEYVSSEDGYRGWTTPW